MRQSVSRTFSCKKACCTVALALASQSLLANGLAITGDSVTIDGTSYSLATGAVAPNPQVTAAQAQTNLTFSFTMQAASGKTVADGSYIFDAGIYLDATATSRRLEVSVSGITMNVSNNGATLAGNIAAGTAAKVCGRSVDNVTVACATLSNDLFTFTGSTLTLNMGSQVNKIQTGSAPLSNIANGLAVGGDYGFAVYLKQTSGPAGLTFGKADGTSIYGCETGSGLTLAGSPSFAGATGIMGLIGIGGAATGAATPLNAATANCSPTPALPLGGNSGGGGSGSTTPTIPTTVVTTTTEQEINSELTTLAQTDLTDPDNITPTLTTQVTDLVTESTTNGAAIASNPEATDAERLSAVTTISEVLDASGDLNQGGATQSTVNLVSSVNTAANLVSSLSESTAPTQILDSVKTLTTNLANNVGESLSTQDSESVARSLSSLLNAAVKKNVTLDTETITAVATVSNNLDTASKALLSKYTAQEQKQVAVSFSVPLLLVDAVDEFQTTESAAVDAYGLLLQTGGVLANFVKTEAQLTRALNTSKSLEENIAEAIAPGATFTFNEAAGRFAVSANGISYSIGFAGAAVMPSSIAEGVTVLSDGSALVKTGDIGFTLPPAVSNLSAFTSALQSTFNASVAVRQSDSVYLLKSGDLTAAVAFSYDDVSPSGATTSSVTFTPPTGNPADPGYRYVVNFTDGSSQGMVPFVLEAGFIGYLFNKEEIVASVSRDTGVITLSDGRKMKADYFVQNFTSTLEVFLENNDSDGDGIVFASIPDANGDGETDYQLVSAAGLQVLYTVP